MCLFQWGHMSVPWLKRCNASNLPQGGCLFCLGNNARLAQCWSLLWQITDILSRSVNQDSTDKWKSKMLSPCLAAIPTDMAIFFIFPTWIAFSLLRSVCSLVGIHMDRNSLTVCAFSDSSIQRPFPQTFLSLSILTLFLPIPNKAAKLGAFVDEAV